MIGWSSQNSGRTDQSKKAATGPQRRGDLALGVVELDRLAPEDLLDLLARHGVERLDAARVHHRQLAELLVGGPDPDLRRRGGGRRGAVEPQYEGEAEAR